MKKIALNKNNFLFKFLLLGKLFCLPFFYIFISFIDNRSNFIFSLPDLERYEDISKLFDLFNFGEIVPNAGFMFLAFFIKSISINLTSKLFIYAFISLVLMSLSQAIILRYIFIFKYESSKLTKIASLILSILNFYILLFSFKPSTDVIGCLGISILLVSLIELKNDQKNNIFFLNNFLLILFICLFRNQLFIVIPFLLFTKLPIKIINGIRNLISIKKVLFLSVIFALLIINLYQILGQLSMFIKYQSIWGAASITLSNQNYFSFDYFLSLIKLFVSKIVYLISARESIGMTSNWLVNQMGDKYISNNIFITNILSSLILFTINTLGSLSIFTVFRKDLAKSFLFCLIPLIPILSYASHHRYFLPYSIITTACVPFLFENYFSRIQEKFLKFNYFLNK